MSDEENIFLFVGWFILILNKIKIDIEKHIALYHLICLAKFITIIGNENVIMVIRIYKC